MAYFNVNDFGKIFLFGENNLYDSINFLEKNYLQKIYENYIKKEDEIFNIPVYLDCLGKLYKYTIEQNNTEDKIAIIAWLIYLKTIIVNFIIYLDFIIKINYYKVKFKEGSTIYNIIQNKNK